MSRGGCEAECKLSVKVLKLKLLVKNKTNDCDTYCDT
jgi:hypothetical protein